MTAVSDGDRDALVRRTLEDLSDDAYRQDGQLRRHEIYAVYLRRGILPDEAIAIEMALQAEGTTIVDEDGALDPNETAEWKSGTALDQLLGNARRHGRVSTVEEAELGYAIQQGLRVLERGRDACSDMDRRILDRAERAKARLITANIGLVAKMAFDRRFRYRMDPEDLVQIGMFGLMRACEKFDPTWGTKFSTYAVWWIRQAIGRGIHDQAATIRLPVHMRERIAKYRRTRRALGLGNEYRASDIDAIADSLGWEEAYTARIAQLSEQKVVSYDAPVNEDGGTIGDFISDESPNPEELAIAADLAEVIGTLVADLDERQRDIVRRRFGLSGREETLQEIGDDYGITRERIRQIEEKALRILRGRARNMGLHRMLEDD